MLNRMLAAWLCGLCLYSLQCGAEEAATVHEDTLGPGMINPGYQEYPAWFLQSFLDIREDIAEAAVSGKRVVLYFYQDGCPYCRKLLETNLASRDTVEKLRSDFAVIAINMWGDREVTDLSGKQTTEKAFAGALRVMFTPTMLFLDEKGDVILRVNGYYPPHRFNAALEYASTHTDRMPHFRDYLQRVAPPPATGILHGGDATLRPPYRLAEREGDRPLLVMFEQKECLACDELHQDILQRPQSRSLLNRFDVVVLDMWSDESLQRPDGRETPLKEWVRELDIQYAPTLVFFDGQGSEVFRTEAWLKAFHIQSVLDYVASGAYREQPSFQRFISARADALEKQGIHVDLME
jgi:thioredoxin-related protein